MLELTRRSMLRAGAAAPLVAAAQAPPGRRTLSGPWNAARLAAALTRRADWRPYPAARERAPWLQLPPALREAAIRGAEAALGQPWPSLPATVFLEYRREGNRSRYEALWSARRKRVRMLALGECCEAKGRFLDELANGLWLTCEETYWGFPAHLNLQRAGYGLPDVEEPTVDLFAADTGSLLAWVEYLLGGELETVSPLLRRRLAVEVRRRILDVCWARDDFWWMGIAPHVNRRMNNWNPWINSNWLTCALLMEDEQRRPAAVAKILRSLDRFLDAYHPDGGCDEGPGYWSHAGGSMFECLELLYSASAGRIDFYNLPLVREIGGYIYRAHIHEDWYVNFADASARTTIAGDLVYRFGKRIQDPLMAAHGAWAVQRSGARVTELTAIARQLGALFHYEEERKAPGAPPLVRDVWLAQTHLFAARIKGGSAAGLYLAAQGGHNAESHNHNDVGNFILYANGEPALIDVGVETYTAKTFSAQRYDIWTMQSAWHNLPTVNGVMQAAGRQYEARECRHTAGDGAAELSMEIAAAWPKEAGLQSWRRTFKLDRSTGEASVRDAVRLARAANQVEFNLVTICEVEPGAAGTLILKGGKLRGARVQLAFDPSLAVEIEERATDDARLRSVWGATIRRIRLLAKSVGHSGDWTLTARLA